MSPRRCLQVLAPIGAGLTITALALAQNAPQPNQAQQPVPGAGQNVQVPNQRVNPNPRAAQQAPGVDNANPNLQAQQQQQGVAPAAPGTPDFNRNINRGRAVGGPNDPDTLNRLRNQMAQARSREVTLTGRVFDLETFFMGDLGTIDGTGARLQGEPISNLPNANRAGPAARGAPGAAVNPNTRGDRIAGVPTPGQATPPAGQAVPQQGQATPAPGQALPGQAAGPGVRADANALRQNTGAGFVGATGQPLVLVTSQGAVLVEASSLAATGVVQGIGELVRVRGQLFERNGLRYLIVTEGDQTFGNQGVPNQNIPNQNLPNQNVPNVAPDNANPQAPAAPSRGERRSRR